MFKNIIKTDNTSWDDISRRVYGLPDKASNLQKLNANIESGEILAPIDSNPPSNDDIGIRLEIGENVYKNFSEYELIDNINSVKAAVFVFMTSDSKYSLDCKSDVKVYDENGLFLEGKIYNIDAHITSSYKWVQAEIKSNAGILADSDCPYPLEFLNLSIKSILKYFCDIYGLEITFSDDKELDEVCVNDIGTSFCANPDEKILSFMIRLAKSRGFFIKDTGSGLFVGRYKQDRQEKINFIYGECTGVKEWHAKFHTDGLARYYEVNSQYPTTQTAVSQVPIAHPVTRRLNSNDFNANDLNSLADKKACEIIGEHFQLVLILNEEYRQLNAGDVAVVKNPEIYIDEETEFIVKKVIPLDNDETKILLVLPCAYTGVMPESLPLC